jgi:phosphoglycerate dehydrogenase-like enzyme
MHRCAILDDYQNAALSFADWTPIEGEVRVQVFNDHVTDRGALVERLKDFSIVVMIRERTRFDRALIESLPKLELLITTGMVNSSIDFVAAKAAGVVVAGTPAATGTTSELTWGLILALLRHIPREFASFRTGGPWQSTIGGNLNGRRLGIVGLGRVGSQVARVAKAFEMDVSVWSRSLTVERARELGVDRRATLDELMTVGDIVSIHLMLNAETRGLITARHLSLMKPTAILVNTARGPIVDEAALIDALRERRIAGAALDVFEREPLPLDHPFRSLDNVVATPHLGYVTESTYRAYFGGVVEDIRGWLDGKPPRVLSDGGGTPIYITPAFNRV